MSPPTRRRLPAMLLIFLLLGLAGVAVFRGAGSDRDARAPDRSTPRTAARHGVPAEAAGRGSVAARDSSEAKLKSLLAVRDGEVAFIRVPAAALERLATGGPEGSGLIVPEGSAAAPSLVAVLNRAMVLSLMTGHAEGIEGDMDASGEDFEWHVPGMALTGTTAGGEGAVTLDFTLTEGISTLECSTRTMPGSVVLLRAGDPAAGGLLLAVGGEFPAAMPGE